MAVPFTLNGHRFGEVVGRDAYLDTLTVGAITLNSTHRSLETQDQGWIPPRSILSFLTVPQLKGVEQIIAMYGGQIVRGGAGA
jgi:hypothetical protein